MTTPQETLQELMNFVQREHMSELEERAAHDLLSERALVGMGYAIDNLMVSKIDGTRVVLNCPINDSRFRPGDRLSFHSLHDQNFKGVLIDLQHGGRQLHLHVTENVPNENSGPWLCSENTTNLTAAVVRALEKLQPGAAGWGLVRSLLDVNSPVHLPPLLPSKKVNADDLYKQLSQYSSFTLDVSQREAFKRCLNLPPVLGVQGPPGTGKTVLLGFVAEGLIRAGKRIVVLALTHQAVNNALSTIHQLFPNRPVVKVGDELRTESLHSEIPIISNASQLRDLDLDVIIGMTFMSGLHRLMATDSRPIDPHVVIIDEAGQLPLAQGICSGLCGAGTILFFGDDRQMPPVFRGDLREEPLALSVFAQLRKTQPDKIFMLEITYRMNAELCDCIRQAFYMDTASSLQPSNTAKNRYLDPAYAFQATTETVKLALAHQPSLTWIKLATHKYMQSNPVEASVVVDILYTLLQNGLPPEEIAVVTPFRRQAVNIRSLLSLALKSSDNLPIIDTVERVQGATVDVVVVSFCASQPDYVTSLANFLFSPNRLNVAVSRARRKAIVISSPNLFDVLPLDYQGIIGRNLCRGLLERSQSFYAAI